MSDTHHDNGSYELLTPRTSLERNTAANRSSYDDNLPQSTNAESPHGHHLGLSGDLSRPHRVRFRSVSQYCEPEDLVDNHRVFSNISNNSSRTLLNPTPRSTDVTDMLRGEPLDKDSDITARYDGSGYSSAPYSPSTPERAPEASSPKEHTPTRSRSAKERWKEASRLIRQKTMRLGERLGRPSDDGETLGTTFNPEELDWGMPLRRFDSEQRIGMGESTDDEGQPNPSAEAHRLVRRVTQNKIVRHRKPKPAYQRSGQSTPERPSSWYGSSRPLSFSGGGILSQLLKLQASQNEKDTFSATDDSDNESVISSGAATPKSGSATPRSGAVTPKKEKLKWYKKPHHQSTASLVEASMNLSRATLPSSTDIMAVTQQKRGKRKKPYQKHRLEDEIRVTVHIAEILARQRYIMQLCRALMRYGAPTHRLEEYMTMTARVLEVEAQFLYLPGCMIMSFGDPVTRTAEVKLVRSAQGVDLGRLAEVHSVYKNVVHDLIGVEEAIQELDEVMKRKSRFSKWILVPVYGLAGAAVGPFAFSARPIDMPIIFLLSSLVGLMQRIIAPRSSIYSNVFEVTAAVLTSFLARAFGSIRTTVNGEQQFLFCFSALAQSSIALILPGFMVLCSSLELQSHQMIAGSIRMVFAIIYSLFLGYGITVGTTIYGLLDPNATSETSCPNLSIYGSKYVQHFIFVPVFVICLAIINQARWKQFPVMIFIATCGYITNYFSTTKLGSRSQVANTVGAFTIGVLGNLYSRLWHGHAAAAILPGIFVLVPSGLASSGSLIAGIDYANQVRQNLKGGSNNTDTSSQDTSIANLGFGMIQVAIGISVGLFIAALVIYPTGKRRSGLFSF
ncbi:threonine/serine exporter family protein [Aspergillus clavatus NRRL 1]|uniref:DUF1212 domain membrane protein n=1 Tax=Aspergillus clavatus (strain ATCC 1007 / CBS 513.65 / DSM 816 / NCTC 3887 / NRRL 1 / QM 1276 / 107) TaxID=344612 RepID=A1CCS6_ASPCL|nr:DUF1212 domain membrane protein [Aspergillus clavatus NRRL 1]EAW12333.1 DUF1212 domain membrane protein [Aspergillus clavatus NRRL 1]